MAKRSKSLVDAEAGTAGTVGIVGTVGTVGTELADGADVDGERRATSGAADTGTAPTTDWPIAESRIGTVAPTTSPRTSPRTSPTTGNGAAITATWSVIVVTTRVTTGGKACSAVPST